MGNIYCRFSTTNHSHCKLNIDLIELITDKGVERANPERSGHDHSNSSGVMGSLSGIADDLERVASRERGLRISYASSAASFLEAE